jgi:hypothetical protein
MDSLTLSPWVYAPNKSEREEEDKGKYLYLYTARATSNVALQYKKDLKNNNIAVGRVRTCAGIAHWI